MNIPDLILQADEIAADCNQLGTARVFAREAKAALGEQQACHELLDEYFEHPKQPPESLQVKLSRFITDAIGILAERDKFEHQLREQSEARRVMAYGLRVAVRHLNPPFHVELDHRKPDEIPYGRWNADILAIRQALAILSPTPNVQESAAQGHSGVSVEVTKNAG